MRALKIILFISFIGFVVFGLQLVFFPSLMAEIQMGPQLSAALRWVGAQHLGFAVAIWYAFRNPGKNVAVVRALITVIGLSILLGLYNGISGVEPWSSVLLFLIPSAVWVALLVYFYPRGEKAT